MKSYQATWEDAEASRQVELVVNYRLDAKRVDINDVTPTRVTFLCQKTQKPLRTIRVWTEGGRKLLARQAAAAGRLATLRARDRRRPAPRAQARRRRHRDRSHARHAGLSQRTRDILKRKQEPPTRWSAAPSFGFCSSSRQQRPLRPRQKIAAPRVDANHLALLQILRHLHDRARSRAWPAWCATWPSCLSSPGRTG